MLVIINFCIDGDIIDVPQFVAENINEYQSSFLEWLFDKSNEHEYWCYEDGEKFGCNYRSEAFVEWLNSNPLKRENEKASVVSSGSPKVNF